MQPIFIYTLVAPSGEIRYVGQTPYPDRRLNHHICVAKKYQYHKARWISGLLETGLRPIMEIIDVVPDNEADFWEREYIQNYRERGFRLTNFSDGGEAPMRGKKHSPETRAKMRAARLGKKMSPEARAKMSAAGLGRKRPPFSLETRAKMRAANLGKKLSPEHCAKLSLANKGKIPWNKDKNGNCK